MYKISVKNSQNEFVNTGMLFQSTWYVDDSIQEGLELGTFCAVQSGTSKCFALGKAEQGTLHQAHVGGPKAAGVVYRASARDRYGRSDNFSDETRYFPYGKREDTAIGLLKNCVIEISTFLKERFFRTYDEVLEEEIEITNANIIPTMKAVYGEKLEVIVNGVSKICHVVSVDENGATVNADLELGTATVVAKCQMDDPIYLNTKPVVENGVFKNREDLPFTTVRISGDEDQMVGYIESPIAVRINIVADVSPAM